MTDRPVDCWEEHKKLGEPCKVGREQSGCTKQDGCIRRRRRQGKVGARTGSGVVVPGRRTEVDTSSSDATPAPRHETAMRPPEAPMPRGRDLEALPSVPRELERPAEEVGIDEIGFQFASDWDQHEVEIHLRPIEIRGMAVKNPSWSYAEVSSAGDAKYQVTLGPDESPPERVADVRDGLADLPATADVRPPAGMDVVTPPVATVHLGLGLPSGLAIAGQDDAPGDSELDPLDDPLDPFPEGLP